MIIYYGEISLTSGEVYLIGHELGNPSTGDVKVLKLGGGPMEDVQHSQKT